MPLLSKLEVAHAAYEVVAAEVIVKISEEVKVVVTVAVVVKIEVENRVVDKEIVDDTEGASVEVEVLRIVLVVLVCIVV